MVGATSSERFLVTSAKEDMSSSLFVCLFFCLSAICAKTYLHEMFRGAPDHGSGIRIRIRIRIVTLVRRALAEVCIVPMLLVTYRFAIRLSIENGSAENANRFTAVEEVDESLQLPEVARQAGDADVVVKPTTDAGSGNRRLERRQCAAQPQHAATRRRRARVK